MGKTISSQQQQKIQPSCIFWTMLVCTPSFIMNTAKHINNSSSEIFNIWPHYRSLLNHWWDWGHEYIFPQLPWINFSRIPYSHPTIRINGVFEPLGFGEGRGLLRLLRTEMSVIIRQLRAFERVFLAILLNFLNILDPAFRNHLISEPFSTESIEGPWQLFSVRANRSLHAVYSVHGVWYCWENQGHNWQNTYINQTIWRRTYWTNTHIWINITYYYVYIFSWSSIFFIAIDIF